MNQKILLVGVISNVSKTLERELKIVLKSLSSFETIQVFLVESDSNDETVRVLKKIQSSNQNFTYISKGQLSAKLPNRVERIAFCRNIYVDRADIAPVRPLRPGVDAAALEMVRPGLSALHQRRNDVVAEVVARARSGGVAGQLGQQQFGVKHIDAHADERAVVTAAQRGGVGGLLLEGLDALAAVVDELQHPER